jgi:hypothetical protein
MKRLFMLRHGKGGAVVLDDNKQPVYFSNKMEAKAQRKDNQVVSIGPDHKQYNNQYKGTK